MITNLIIFLRKSKNRPLHIYEGVFMKKLLFLLGVVLVSCSQQSPTKTTNYHYSDVEDHIDWYDSFVQDSDEYLVYYYSETCAHCTLIKQEIIVYYFSEVEEMYFVNTNLNSKFGPTKDLKGICDINEFYIFGTPFLVKFKNHIVSDYYPGVSKILDYLNR